MGEIGTDDPFASSNLPKLLGRPLRSIATEDGACQVRGARVLVTGAGGSVGSALVARLVDLEPERIVALDTHEASLFRLARDLAPKAPLDLRVADVRNVPKVRRVFQETRPTIVFHLAAYKHVPLGEREPDEPVSVNVLGTHAVATAAVEAHAEHFVYPSSDKAVNPPSVYGATKRIAETLLLALARSHTRPAIHIVRYVNIIGSSGSVLETFVDQSRTGSPLTLTEPRMTRYWMAMDEAVDLVLHALGMPSASRTMLDPGEAVRVQTMAERVYGLLRGRTGPPRFVVGGPRPGERLAEELASPSEKLARCGDGPILQVLPSAPDRPAPNLDGVVDEISTLLAVDDAERLRARIMELARLFQ